MPLVIPSLLKLIGRGFLADAYAVDGNHLRWMFDPRLGFPRTAFCLERRPALGTPRGNEGVKFHGERFALDIILLGGGSHFSQETTVIIRDGVSVYRPGGTFNLTENGVELSSTPVVVDFHGGNNPPSDPQACYARLTFVTFFGGSSGHADALYSNKGEFEIIDQASFVTRRNLRDDLGDIGGGVLDRGSRAATRINEMLEAPETGSTTPRVTSPDAARLFRTLAASDPQRFSRVTPGFLDDVLGHIREGGFDVRDVVPRRGVRREVVIDVRGDRIDRIALTGNSSYFLRVDWCTPDELNTARGWEPVDCYPIATRNKDYVERNANLLGPDDVKPLAEKRVLDPLPNGAEPLDDPQVPPSRPPKPEELIRRYVVPWIDELEPGLDKVLTESLAGALHQSEITVNADLTHLGQKVADPFPSDVPGEQTMGAEPYGMILLASCAFPTARILGLAAIDKVEPNGFFDYRVRGVWDIKDIATWGFKLQRDVKALQDQLTTATDAERPDLQARLMDKLFELITFTPFINFLTSQATNGQVTIHGLKLGVVPASRPLFDPPTSLSAASIGLAVPPLDTATDEFLGLTELSWPLRQRARAIVHETIPMGATLGRNEAPKDQPFDLILNTHDPDSDAPVMEVPQGPDKATGTAGTASFIDPRTPERHTWRYGVSEVDPFGRWSPFTTADFIWSNDVPPPAPVQLTAELGLDGTPPVFVITVRFSWPADRFPVASHTFFLHLRRTPPPSSSPGDPTQWGLFDRLEGGGVGAFSFAGTFSGDVFHDGMPVTVAFVDRTVDGETIRDYTVTFHGAHFNRDAINRASAWIGVSTVNNRGIASEEVTGPARADDILNIPPSPPPLPPDPLLSSFPDAEHLSSFKLEWAGQADVRYTVYRGGEREIVQYCEDRGIDTSAYDPDGPANFRAAALKSLSVLAPDAFQPRSPLIPDPPRDGSGKVTDPTTWPPLPAGGRSHVDELPGQLRSLTVYAVLGKSKSGVRTPWPTDPSAFAVVAVPQIPEPERPRVLQGNWMPPDDPSSTVMGPASSRVELLIAKPDPATGAVTEYEVYRTLDPTKTNDYRLMRRLHGLPSPVFEPGPSPDGALVARYIDPTIGPYKTYFYKVVARANGTRSDASAPASVLTLSGQLPAAATDLTTIRSATELSVSFKADAPSTSAGDFVFEARKETPAGPLILSRNTGRHIRQGTTNEFILIVDPGAIAPGDKLFIRVTDPLGRFTDSPSVVST